MAEIDESDWQTSPPWVVFDPDTKAEWVTPRTLRYYVTNVGGKWFICDRFTNLAIPGTESESRTKSIRLFYELNNRPLPAERSIPQPVKGTRHGGIG